MRPQQLQAPRGEQVICRRRMRAIHREDVDPRQHLVEALPISCFELLLDLVRHAAAVVVVDRQAEAARAAGDRLADGAHDEEAEPLAPQTMAEPEGWAPALPLALTDPPLAHAQA